MKKYILSENGNFYKANLHCHTTCSDGKLTPEEIKKIYKEKGYSIVAYSDHNFLIDHSDLTDNEFLALTAVEIDINKKSDRPSAFEPCYHINFFAPDPHMDTIPCFNPNHIRFNKSLIESQKYYGTHDYERDYNKVNELISEFAKLGFITMLNHPTWSLQSIEDYKDLDNIFAVEMYNHGCYVEGYEEINAHVFDRLLKMGKKVFCTATDDNHNGNWNGADENSPFWDSFGGWVVIKADKLDYTTIFESLKAGNFYASTGPQIKELYIEDNALHVKTSPAARITLTTEARKSLAAYPEKNAEAICDAVFPLDRIYEGAYLRINVDDGHGHFAWSQPIYTEFNGRK